MPVCVSIVCISLHMNAVYFIYILHSCLCVSMCFYYYCLMVNCAFLTSFIFNSDKHIYEIDEMQFYVCVYVCIYAGTVLFLILP